MIMLSNKVRRNIWLAMSVVSVAVVVDRSIRFANEEIEWWRLVSAIVIMALCIKFYWRYRREVRNGNMFGRVNCRQRRNCHRSGQTS